MRNLLLLIAFVLILSGCKKDDGQGSEDKTPFEQFEDQYLDGLWKLNPSWAAEEGYHKYDSVLVIPNEQSRTAELMFIKSQLSQLTTFDVKQLTPLNQVDYHLIQNELQYSQWQIDTLKQYQWDPSSYNVIGSFAHILNENYAPLPSRLRRFYQKMTNVAAYYDEAKKQIKNPVVELTDLAISQHLNGVSVIEKDFADSLKKTNIAAAEQKQMLARAQTAAKVIKNFAQWLKDLKNPTPRSFRLGKDLYAQKFRYETQAAYTAAQLYDSAMVRKNFVHRQMFKLSKQLWPKYFGTKPMPADSMQLIGKVIDTLSAKHVKQQDFQAIIEKIIPLLENFVKQKNLLYIDPAKPLVVRKEPAYMAGVASASVSAPGPYDKNGNTYFNVGSLDGWPADKADQYLREFNNYILPILCIHEAVPGHYTQLVYANQTPGIVKSVLGSGTMIEGWAVYGEQMMLENGYGDNAPEMWLMWYKWHLRSVSAYLIDYNVHAGNMTKDEVIKLLTRETFKSPKVAEETWTRLTLSSVQFTTYYTGYKEITDLREAYKKKLASAYKLKDFNEKFLSYGSSPVKYIKELMMTTKAPADTSAKHTAKQKSL